MTSVEIQFRLATSPTEAVISALAAIREVYGIRRLRFDHSTKTLCVEYDATRLNAAAVSRLIRQAGLEIEAERPLIPLPPVPEQAPTA